MKLSPIGMRANKPAVTFEWIWRTSDGVGTE